MSVRRWASITAIGYLQACSSQRQQPSPAPVPLRSGPEAATYQAIWRPILELYGQRRVRTEGDITLEANRMTGVGEQRDRSKVVLMAYYGPEQQPFFRPWLDSVLAERLVEGACAADSPENCSDNVMTSYLTLSIPTIRGDTLALVSVNDRALNPTACRRSGGDRVGTGGFMNLEFTVAKLDGHWVALRSTRSTAGSIIC